MKVSVPFLERCLGNRDCPLRNRWGWHGSLGMRGVVVCRNLLDPLYPREPVRRVCHRLQHQPRSSRTRWGHKPEGWMSAAGTWGWLVRIRILKETYFGECTLWEYNEKTGLREWKEACQSNERYGWAKSGMNRNGATFEQQQKWEILTLPQAPSPTITSFLRISAIEVDWIWEEVEVERLGLMWFEERTGSVSLFQHASSTNTHKRTFNSPHRIGTAYPFHIPQSCALTHFTGHSLHPVQLQLIFIFCLE